MCITAHGYTGLAHAFPGSMAETVIRNAPCPVLAVRGFGKDRLCCAGALHGAARAGSEQMTRTHPTAEHEKRRVALTSLWAAIFITAFKIIVGLLTGSMGILAEAAHSGLDLAAALMTFLAIRIAAKPADQEHPYGHGKIENLSAMFETLLLLITCAWIVWEAGHRLVSGQVNITVNVWSFLVMVTSIIVDYSRSRALSRAAKKHSS